MPSAVPKVVPGRLEVERRVGQGGAGVVYRAIDLTLGRRIAIKTSSALASPEVEPLRREAQALAAISHRHLATVYGFEVFRGHPLLLMEWLDGGTLADRIPLPLPSAVEVMVAVSEALLGLHSIGLVHRDVKPRNIAFNRGGEPKLLDFSLAHRCSAGADRSETAASRIAGTLPYVPPEAFSHQAPSPAFDVWALCVVFYETLCAHRPFAGESPRALIDAIHQRRYSPVERHLPAAPSRLREFFSGAFGADVSRPIDALELRRRLEPLRRLDFASESV